MKLAHQFDRGAAKKMFDDLGEKDIKKMNLTEDWQNKKLKWHKSYYCKNKKGEIVVATLLGDDILYSKELGGTLNIGYWDVLTPCDYDVLAHLETKAEWQAERIKELEQDVKTLTNNYKLLEKQQAENLAHGQALVDEFGDFETLYEELKNLRSLVKECKNIVAHDCWQEAQFPDGQVVERQDFLTRLNAAIGESEEK